MRLLPLVLLVLAGCADDGGGWTAGAGCQMRVVAELPVLNDHGSPVVRAAVNGKPVAFVVDTGARTSLLFEEAADQLGLPTDNDASHLLTGIGGSAFSKIVTVDSLSLGTAAAHHQEFDSLPGGRQRFVRTLPVVGLFGGDFLANYDVQFDLPGHLVTLYDEHGCNDNLRPWAQGAFYRLPFQLDNDTAISLRIALDGHPIPVVLDSGAYRTIIDDRSGAVGGATRASMATDRSSIARGIDGNAVASHRHRFDSLDIGPEHFAPAWLNVADIVPDGLLGADFFRARRVWVSYPHQVLYVQRVLFPAHPAGAAPAGGGSASAAAAPGPAPPH